MLTASPPREVFLYLVFMSAPVSRMVLNDGDIRAVTLAGGAQGAVQLAFQVGSGVQQQVALQRQCKHAGGAHRPHGVRAARSDANLEEVKKR